MGLVVTELLIYNHTFPEYLNSTLILSPPNIQTYIQTEKTKIAPKPPFLLSLVVTLITPPHYPLRIYRSIPTNPIIPNFSELDCRRLARLKATNERQDYGAGILHQVAQFPIDQVYLIYEAPMPLSTHARPERQGTGCKCR